MLFLTALLVYFPECNNKIKIDKTSYYYYPFRTVSIV